MASVGDIVAYLTGGASAPQEPAMGSLMDQAAAQAPTEGSLQPMPPGHFARGAENWLTNFERPAPDPNDPVLYRTASPRVNITQGDIDNGMNVAMAAGAGTIKGALPISADVAPAVQKVIRAYHGSPHDFDAFSLDKIGTGEGAQAYGHGLYFAENEGVAKGYRDNLSQGLATATQPRIPVGDVDYAIMEAGSKAGDIPQRRLDTLSTNITEALRMGLDPREAAMGLAKTDKERAAAEAMLEAGKQYFPSAPGKMYEVNINADPEHFLDWDKPLSEQPPKVKEILSSVQLPQGVDKDAVQRALAGNETPYDRDWNPTTGAALYRQIAKAPKNDPNAAASQLAQAGIPGIKYLDQGSRAAGDGSRNYVLFDDKLVNIARKYGMGSIAALPPALAAVGQSGDQNQ